MQSVSIEWTLSVQRITLWFTICPSKGGTIMAEAAAAPTTAGAAADRSRVRFATVIVAGHALKHTLTSGLAAALIPEIKAGLSLSDTQVGSLGTVQQFTGWGATMGSGYLGDRFTQKTGLMLAISLGFTSTALLVLGLSPSYPVLLVGMLLMGLGPSMFHPPAVGALSRRFADRRAFVISLHGMGGSLGEVSGPLAGAGLLAIFYWRDVLKIEFLPGILAAFFMWRLLNNSESASSLPQVSFKEYAASFLKLLRRRALLMVFLVTAFRGVGQSVTSIFLPVYLRDDLGYSAALVGLYISLGQLAGVGSQPLMGILSDRIGHKLVILPALAMFAILLAIIPVAEGKLQLALVILAMGTFVFSMQSILTSAAIEIAGEEIQSTVVSLIYASTFVGSLSPTIAGVLADAYGREVVFVFASILVGVAAALMAMTPMPSRHG
jgi:FSR family fosmidomycin resistance protein-like MFS transporter